MRKLLILTASIVLSLAGFAQDESWKSKTAWFNQETAESAKDVLKNNKKVMVNIGCATGWGAITISTIKKVWTKESNTGEGNYDLWIKYETSLGEMMSKKVHLDWIKIQKDGHWIYLAKELNIEGTYCGN